MLLFNDRADLSHPLKITDSNTSHVIIQWDPPGDGSGPGRFKYISCYYSMHQWTQSHSGIWDSNTSHVIIQLISQVDVSLPRNSNTSHVIIQ